MLVGVPGDELLQPGGEGRRDPPYVAMMVLDDVARQGREILPLGGIARFGPVAERRQRADDFVEGCASRPGGLFQCLVALAAVVESVAFQDGDRAHVVDDQIAERPLSVGCVSVHVCLRGMTSAYGRL